MPTRTTKADDPAADAAAVPVLEAQLAANEELVEAVVGNALRRQIAFWAGALILLAGFLYLFSSILLPFAAGMVLAYFLDPLADRLEAWLGSRLVASAPATRDRGWWPRSSSFFPSSWPSSSP